MLNTYHEDYLKNRSFAEEPSQHIIVGNALEFTYLGPCSLYWIIMDMQYAKVADEVWQTRRQAR